ARALLAAPGHHLALLPEGEATIEKRGELKVNAGGQSRTVIQCAITGLDFSPSPVWLDPDGTFFAASFGWITIIREGWESSVDAINKAQGEFEQQRSAELARSLAHTPPGPLVFVHANLFDSEAALTRANQTVVITGNKITAVGPDSLVKVPANAQVIDAAGKTPKPGLWDMHVNLFPRDGLLNMAAGVTTVRDLANDTDYLLATRRRFDEGSEIGPRVLMAGFLDGRGPYH